MQSERITILTSPAAKRTIAARASANGLSMGEYVRRRALEGGDELTAKEEAELSALAAEVNIAIPKMQASIDRMIATLDRSHQETDAFLRKMGGALMGFVSDAATALKSVVLMQSNIERLERSVERQDRDIAGLRDAMALMNERIVRMETKFEIYERQSAQRRIEE